MTDVFVSVIDLLIHCDKLTLGTLIRLRRCNKALKTFIEENELLDHFFSKKLGYKQIRTFTNVMTAMKLTQRCRECGLKCNLTALTTKMRVVKICTTCQREENNYNELVSRKQVLNTNLNRLWSKKRKALLKDVYFARRSTFNKILYWGHHWRKSMLTFKQCV
jgi:hypothetical protein